MEMHSLTKRVLAVALALSLPAVFMPAVASEDGAAVKGALLSARGDVPVPGARLHLGDPKTGEIYTSEPTDKDGAFALSNLPAATYELAVETDGKLFLVGTPVKLAPGQTRDLNVAVNEEAAPSPEEKKKKTGTRAAKLWNNPATAAALVIGGAFLIGIAIDSATDDEGDASPSS